MGSQRLGGSYLILAELPSGQNIKVGKLKATCFPHGHYAYIGSALAGLEARVKRHLREGKKIHWHIDYFLKRAIVSDVILCESEQRMECNIARAFQTEFDCIPRFGSSDCRCPSHLFFSPDDMKTRTLTLLGELGLKPRLVSY
jgi:Uri superfamily endonuclease